MKQINLASTIKAYDSYRNFYNREKYPDEYENALNDWNDKAHKVAVEINLVQANNIHARTISAAIIMRDIAELSTHFHGIAKKDMIGITVTVNHNAQSFPGSYGYIPYCTLYQLRHNGKTWILTDLYRGICNNKRYQISLSETAKTAIIAAIENGK